MEAFPRSCLGALVALHAVSLASARGLASVMAYAQYVRVLLFSSLVQNYAESTHCSLADSGWFAIVGLYFWAAASVGCFKIPQFEDTSDAAVHPDASPLAVRDELGGDRNTNEVVRRSDSGIEAQTSDTQGRSGDGECCDQGSRCILYVLSVIVIVGIVTFLAFYLGVPIPDEARVDTAALAIPLGIIVLLVFVTCMHFIARDIRG